jgi:HEAT repeat protein
VEDDSSWLLEQLLTTLAEDPDASVRAAAAGGLEPFAQRAELGDLTTEDTERVRAGLLKSLHRSDEREDVRAAALAALGFFSDQEAQRELQRGFNEESLRLAALRGMGNSADPSWLDLILEQFDDANDDLREVAATAAGDIGDEEAVPELVNLIDDPAHGVRLAAIEALGTIGGTEAREALVYALSDERSSIREAAQAAIDELDFYEDPLAG